MIKALHSQEGFFNAKIFLAATTSLSFLNNRSFNEGLWGRGRPVGTLLYMIIFHKAVPDIIYDESFLLSDYCLQLSEPLIDIVSDVMKTVRQLKL